MQAPHPFPWYTWWSRSLSPALYYFTNHHEANALLACLPHGPIGFDLEWRPTFRKGQPENRVALVQLATADTVILLHVHFMTRMCLLCPLTCYADLFLRISKPAGNTPQLAFLDQGRRRHPMCAIRF